jgi:LAGLIDADG endonuclease
MNLIKDYLNSGIIEKVSTRPNSVTFVVYKNSDILTKIIPFFKENNLLGVKLLDFNDFIKTSELISKNKHLDLKGIEEIYSIKKSMNSKRILT